MRLKALDGIRGLMALFVALQHAYILHSFYDAYWRRHCDPLLDIFFIMSGFVIGLVYEDRLNGQRAFGGFMLRRFGRGWPLNALALAFLVGVELLRALLFSIGWMHGLPAPFHYPRPVAPILPSLFFLQSWTPGARLTWNYPAWTISCEILAYALFGLLCLSFRRPAARAAAAALATVAAGCIYAVNTHGFAYIGAISLSRAVAGFFFGYLLLQIRRWRPLRGARLASVLETLAIAGVIGLATLAGPAYLLDFAVTGFAIYVFAADAGCWSALLADRPLQWLGERSFSLYMVHVPLLAALDLGCRLLRKLGVETLDSRQHLYITLGNQWANDALTIGYAAAALAASAVVYKHIEAPARNFTNRLASRWSAAPAARARFAVLPAQPTSATPPQRTPSMRKSA